MSFGLCSEKCSSRFPPHTVPIHGLGVGILFMDEDGGEITVYNCTVLLLVGQAPLSIYLKKALIVSVDEKTKVNKVFNAES